MSAMYSYEDGFLDNLFMLLTLDIRFVIFPNYITFSNYIFELHFWIGDGVQVWYLRLSMYSYENINFVYKLATIKCIYIWKWKYGFKMTNLVPKEIRRESQELPS